LAVLATSNPLFVHGASPTDQTNTTTPPNVPVTRLKIIEAHGISIFYREAGLAEGSVLLLLQGYFILHMTSAFLSRWNGLVGCYGNRALFLPGLPKTINSTIDPK
jgi:hypothetical protein